MSIQRADNVSEAAVRPAEFNLAAAAAPLAAAQVPLPLVGVPDSGEPTIDYLGERRIDAELFR